MTEGNVRHPAHVAGLEQVWVRDGGTPRRGWVPHGQPAHPAAAQARVAYLAARDDPDPAEFVALPVGVRPDGR